MQELTNKQLLFANEYVINGQNHVEAAKQAGYAPDKNGSYASSANSALNSPLIQAKIKDLQKSITRRYEITQDKIANELACTGFFDIAEVLNDDGSVKPLSKMPIEARRALNGFKIEQKIDKDGKATSVITEVKTESKTKSLEILARYKKMLTDTVEHRGNINHTHSVNTIDLDERINQLVDERLQNALQ